LAVEPAATFTVEPATGDEADGRAVVLDWREVGAGGPETAFAV
jgi:hypothetical protein